MNHLNEDLSKDRTTFCVDLLSNTHLRAKALHDFVIQSEATKAWYLQNQDKIKLVDDGIELQGLVFCLDNEEDQANGVDVWNNEGHTYFTFDAAQKHAAEHGKRVPTDEEWQNLVDFLPEFKSISFFIDVLKVPLVGYRSPDESALQFHGIFTYLWSSSEIHATGAYSRHLHYRFIKVLRSYNLKTFGFNVRCVKD